MGGSLNQENLTVAIVRDLRATLFSGGLRISPRRVAQIGQEFVAAFYQFLEQDDRAVACAYGRRLAHDGLGHRAILTLTETLRTGNETGLAITGRYVGAILEGYMAGREADLLQAQTQTHQALDRARETDA